jgi:hypothetical protein
MPLLTADLHPKFCFLNKVFTSQGQLTAVAILRTKFTFSTSLILPNLGPSDATYNRFGLIFFITSKTLEVVSGRLNTKKRIAVFN